MNRRNFLKNIVVVGGVASALPAGALAQALKNQTKDYHGIEAQRAMDQSLWDKTHPVWPDYREWQEWDHSFAKPTVKSHFLTYVPFDEDPRYHYLCRETVYSDTDLKDMAIHEADALARLKFYADHKPKLEGNQRLMAIKFPNIY